MSIEIRTVLGKFSALSSKASLVGRPSLRLMDMKTNQGKQAIVYVILFFSWSLVKGQEPPHYFRIDNKILSGDSVNLLKKYEFETFYFKYLTKIKKRENQNFIYKEDIIKDSIHLFLQIAPNISKADIIMLAIKDSLANKIMTIYIRVKNQVNFPGEVFSLDSLTFEDGVYFYDDCDTMNKYRSNVYLNKHKYKTHNYRLNDLNQHRITMRKLNKILRNCNCNED